MSSYAKALNECRRLPREIDRLEAQGRHEHARKTREHLEQSKRVVEQRGGRSGFR